MKVAVVILNWNGKQLLEQFLPSVVQYSKEATVYVADNASTDDSVAFIKDQFPEVSIVVNPTNTGYAGGYNDALQHIEADVYGGSFDSPFDLHYRPPKTDIDLETGKAINEPGEFIVMETRPRPAYEPGDWELEYENMSVKDAISDIERVEKIATNKRRTRKKGKYNSLFQC